MQEGTLDMKIQWSRNPATGDIGATLSWIGPEGQPMMVSAKANERAVRAALMRKFGPRIKQLMANPQTAAAGFNLFKAVSSVVKKVTKLPVIKQVAGAVRKVANNPIAQAVFPPFAATKIATQNPMARQLLSKALTPFAGPLAPILGPKLLQSAGAILYGAQKGDAAAMEKVKAVVNAAKGGSPAAKAMATVMQVALPHVPKNVPGIAADMQQAISGAFPLRSTPSDHSRGLVANLAVRAKRGNVAAQQALRMIAKKKGVVVGQDLLSLAGWQPEGEPIAVVGQSQIRILSGLSLEQDDVIAISGDGGADTEYLSIAGMAPEDFNGDFTAIAGAAGSCFAVPAAAAGCGANAASGNLPAQGQDYKLFALATRVLLSARAGNPKPKAYIQSVLSRAASGDQKAIQSRDLLLSAARSLPPQGQPAAPAPAAARVDPRLMSAPPAAARAPRPRRGGMVPAALSKITPRDRWLRGEQIDPRLAAVFARQRANGQAVLGQNYLALRTQWRAGKPVPQIAKQLFQAEQAEIAQLRSTGAVAGGEDLAGGSVAYGQGPWNPTPMNLQNYYQISGIEVPQSAFYGDGVVDVMPETDIIVGADGVVMGKVWDGAKWVWEAIKPKLGIRGEAESFGTRDALLQGMQSMQARQMNL